MTGSLTVPTRDLLDAIRDVTPFTSRNPDSPARGLLLHARRDRLAVTGTSDPTATIAASAAVLGSDGTWTDESLFVLDPTAVGHLNAFSSVARRPDGVVPHEITLTLTTAGHLQITEAGGLFPATADVTITPQIDPDDWPDHAVAVAIAGQLDPAMPPATPGIEPELLSRIMQVAKRRGTPARPHSSHDERCLVSVGGDWIASVPTVSLLPTRSRAINIFIHQLQQEEAAA